MSRHLERYKKFKHLLGLSFRAKDEIDVYSCVGRPIGSLEIGEEFKTLEVGAQKERRGILIKIRSKRFGDSAYALDISLIDPTSVEQI